MVPLSLPGAHLVCQWWLSSNAAVGEKFDDRWSRCQYGGRSPGADRGTDRYFGIDPTEKESCWEYYLLVNWAKQSRVQRSGLIEHIQRTIVEVLFDIVRAERVSFERIPQPQLSSQLTLIDIDRAFGLAVQQQQQWQQAGLNEVSPDRGARNRAGRRFRAAISASAHQALQVCIERAT